MRSLLAIVSMLFCVAAGVQLLGIQPAQENSIFGMIAHGLGLYCIGKGLYCAGDLWPRQAVSPALPVATTPRRPPSWLERNPRVVTKVLVALMALALLIGAIGSAVSYWQGERDYQRRLRSAKEYEKTHPGSTMWPEKAQ